MSIRGDEPTAPDVVQEVADHMDDMLGFIRELEALNGQLRGTLLEVAECGANCAQRLRAASKHATNVHTREALRGANLEIAAMAAAIKRLI